ncbi:MAG: zinc ABC transporter substrate-binding protein [Verrucomicrobiota bacterium]|nr:zinc ABC transporter substrate-binding protein [Verrucomicrobiota bacterium]
MHRLFCLFILLLGGCGAHQASEPAASKKEIKILCTIAQIGDLAREIGGERVQVQVLVHGELNPHYYELVKGDEEKLGGAQLVVYQGLGLEHGASVRNFLKKHPNAFALGEAIERIHPEKILWKGEIPDPHLWMDVSLWREGVDPLMEQMIALDPTGADEYRARADLLKEQMETADHEIEALLGAIPAEKRYLVTSHDAFHYFVRRYFAEKEEVNWNTRFAAPEGLAPDGQLNPIDLQKIVAHLAKYRIEVLFPETNVSRDSIRKIALASKEMGLSVRICREALYGDSLRGNYLEAMKHNAKTIADNLGGAHGL